MRIFHQALVSSLILAAPLALAACSDSDDPDNDDAMGGASGDGDSGDGDSTGGDGDSGDGDSATPDPFEDDRIPSSLSCLDTADISADITEDTVLCADTEYHLTSDVHVTDGTTLYIEPGTVISSLGSTSTLVVSRGGKLNAYGTADAPIVFTSGKADGSKAAGDWGGLVILGKGENFEGTDVPIEGIAGAADENSHGGTDNADNSGHLEYMRIEFSGTVLSNGSEINGLTFGSVGSGTFCSHIQVNTTLDDGFEWFGGAVDCDHLVVNNEGDDMFDMDMGYKGTLDTFFGRHVQTLTEDPNGLEWDSDDGGATPVTTVTAKNGTLCGNGDSDATFPSWGALWREQLDATIDGLVLVGFNTGFTFDDNGTKVTLTNGYVGDYDTKCEIASNGWDGGECAAWFDGEDSNMDAADSPTFNAEDCGAADGPNATVTGSGVGAFKDSADWMNGWTNFSVDSSN